MTVKTLTAGPPGWSPAYAWFSTGRPWLREKLAARLILLRGRLRQWREGWQPAAAKAGKPSPEKES
jgi:hypothetical protein